MGWQPGLDNVSGMGRDCGVWLGGEGGCGDRA